MLWAVASDDESTQPIDIDGLRSSLASSGAGARPRPKAAEPEPPAEHPADRPDDTFATDEHPALATEQPPSIEQQLTFH